jgi:hypothetical protein
MEFMFGTQEQITAIQDVPLKGPQGESLCLAYKTSTKFFLAGIYLRDDGYVLKVVDNDKYIPLAEPRLSELQAAGQLPRPLPPYSISPWEYFQGYSLWFCLAVCVVLEGLRRRRRDTRLAKEAKLPITTGPPRIVTKADRFVADEFAKLTRPGETVQHQAYAVDRPISGIVSAASAKGYFAVLTDQRLLLIETRVGAFGVLCENHGVQEIPREDIVAARRDVIDYLKAPTDAVILTLRDGSQRTLIVTGRGLSNQKAFVRDVPRLLVASSAGSDNPNPDRTELT